MIHLWQRVAQTKLGRMFFRTHRLGKSSGWMCGRSSLICVLAISFIVLWAIMLTDIFLAHSGETVLLQPVEEDNLSPFQPRCTFETCFNLSLCHMAENGTLGVHVYPNQIFVNEEQSWLVDLPSQDYAEILTAIRHSRFYQADPDKACVFVPSAVDTLNLAKIRSKDASQILNSLPSWRGGDNHLLFSMLFQASHLKDLAFGKAMVAGGCFLQGHYRRRFDIAIPMLNPRTIRLKLPRQPSYRQYVLLVVVGEWNSIAQSQLSEAAGQHHDVLILSRCQSKSKNSEKGKRYNNEGKRCYRRSVYNYPHVLLRGEFCLLPYDGPVAGSTVLADALKTGCVPVIAGDDYVLPFGDHIDWRRAAIRIHPSQIEELPNILRAISYGRRQELRRQINFLFQRYFSSFTNVALTALEVLEQRIMQTHHDAYERWNDPPFQNELLQNDVIPHTPRTSPIFVSHISQSASFFTAVILSYNRFHTLRRVLEKIDKVPSLIKIIIVWNNVNVRPPAMSKWPKLKTELVILPMTFNRLSNRFIPFQEITTDCILALDDDMEMITPSELEFGFQVWKEFPDRLVGFPGRRHNWNSDKRRFHYSSMWASDLSMVLTGAAFHHKFYSHLYTYRMPKAVRHWVNKHMNCEDIAMNFLVARFTGKPPIKVAPRKRFRCERCSQNESLWDGPEYFQERNYCLNNFTRFFGGMPLKKVDYRADPVMYLEPGVSDQDVRFHVGQL